MLLIRFVRLLALWQLLIMIGILLPFGMCCCFRRQFHLSSSTIGWFQWHVLPGKDEWDFYHELFGIDLSHTGWLPTDFYDNMQKRWIAIAVWMAEFPIIWLVLWTYIILQPITISISLTSVDFIFEFCVVISLWTGLVGIFSEIFELLNRW